MLPTRNELLHWFSYDMSAGVFTWREEPRPVGGRIGLVAGTVRRTGYRFIKVPGYRQIGAHRLAWIYVYGGIPEGLEVDHRDGNPSNNRIGNLRLATSSQQKQNKRVQRNNQSGLKGAFYHSCHRGKKWRSQIKAGGAVIFLGYYDTAEAAHTAYAEACKRHFGVFARAA